MIQMPNFTELEITQISAFIADKLSPVVMHSAKIRNDRNGIQIDYALLTENHDKIPAIKFTFDMPGDFGMTVVVKLSEFQAGPVAYMRDLLENINGIRFAALQQRAGKRDEIAKVMQVMKTGPKR